jgi:hypothetical protein
VSLQWPTPPPPPSQVPAIPSGAPLEQRRGIVENTQAFQARVHWVTGTVPAVGAGNATKEISFPVWFLDRPAFLTGWQLDDGQTLEPNNFPRVSIGVAQWTLHTPAPHVSYYVGAVLAVSVTAGRADQKLIVHYQVQGMALRSPKADATGSVDTVL